MKKWLNMSASDIGRGIAKLDIDPVELTENYLNAIDNHESGYQVYARVTAERAIEEAKAAQQRARSGNRLSLLDGVPISWKDLFDTAAVGTESGSALLSGRVPNDDAIVLKNATQLGLICLGKTHMTELAFSGLGLNPVTATPPNKNDDALVPGGSSSGAALSVSFNLAAAAIGSDTGGSVRIPAAWNDLVGLKTTSGRLSLEGVVPLCLQFDTIGPLCRTVEDAGNLFAILEGRMPRSAHTETLKGLRFAALQTVVLDGIQDSPLEAYENALELIQLAGANIEPLDIIEIAEATALSSVLYSTEAYGLWRNLIEASPEKMFSKILERFRAGKLVSGPDYVDAWSQLNAIRLIWNNACAAYDAVLLPTSPILPPNKQRLCHDNTYYINQNLLALRNTRVANLMNTCALTLPTDVPSCGIMLIGKPNMEELLLRHGRAVESILTKMPQ
ncbi:MAG: amidase [Aestuariivita sp.]|nr:amidase [Aestuariivita sp.]